MISTLLHRLNPKACLAPCGAGCGVDSSWDRDDGGTESSSLPLHAMPQLVEDLTAATSSSSDAVIADKESKARRTRALRRLYELSCADRKHNRVPLVCTSKWDVTSALASCLVSTCPSESDPDPDDDEARRLACLTLNNLSVPYENKAVMILGRVSTDLLGGLLHVIRTGAVQSYLCIICLMNLSFLEDAADPILNFRPPAAGGGQGEMPGVEMRHDDDDDDAAVAMALVDNRSLLRTLEHLMQTFSPFLASKVVSVEGEAIRWAVGLLRNLTKSEERAGVLIRTDIPRIVVTNLRNTPNPVVRWTKDSLEEMSLVVLCNLVRWPDSRECLRKLDTIQAIEPILGKGGIHDFRAGMIQCAIEASMEV